jgi:thiol-disulfide isomerase/thioredoxin
MIYKIMKNSILLFSFVILMCACTSKKHQEQHRPVIITGVVHNYHKPKAKFSHREYTLFSSLTHQQVTINSDGSFKLEIKADAPFRGFFQFGKTPATYTIHVSTPSSKDSTFERSTYDPHLIYVYAEPRDSIHMQFDVNNISKTLKFSGDSPQNSMFVNKVDQRFDSYQDKVLSNYYNIVTWGPQKYERLINQKKKQELNFLNNYKKTHDISEHLVKVYKWSFIADAVTAKIYYKSSREGFLGDSVSLPANYYDFMEGVPLANDFSNKGIGYFYFLDSYFKKKYELKTGKQIYGQDYYNFVKTQIGGKPAYEYLAFALGRAPSRSLYDEFDKDCPYPQLAQLVRKKYEPLKSMFAGSAEPKVLLENISGQAVPLSKFKGHYVYLDFWATWCGPCIKQIPSLEKLKKEYKDKNIKFISISFDSKADKEKWKNFVRKRDMTKIQLWADSLNKKKISNAFNIKMIPRFVLIDDEGKIVDANAPRPSKKGIKDFLNKNLSN